MRGRGFKTRKSKIVTFAIVMVLVAIAILKGIIPIYRTSSTDSIEQVQDGDGTRIGTIWNWKDRVYNYIWNQY